MNSFGKPTALVTRLRAFSDFFDDLFHERVEIAVREKQMRRRTLVPKRKPAGEPYRAAPAGMNANANE